MGKGPYKRARMRDITGRWPVPERLTPGVAERVHDVPPIERHFEAGNELVDDARTRHIPRSARRTKRSVRNTRRGDTSGQARYNRGRKGVIQRS